MEDSVARYYIVNDTVQDASENPAYPDITSDAVYEVIRIINGVPLFFEDHYERMKESLEAIGRSLKIAPDRLKQDIGRLLEANLADNCNVKIIICSGNGNNSICGCQTRLAYISKSYYPPKEVADEGVKTGLLRMERRNPNVKLVDKDYKNAVSRRIREGGFFEVILVDSGGRITEGSKSNVFFVRDGTILTAPGWSVLKGITRKYVIEACKSAGYEVAERFMKADEINEAEGAFLSGTSINVLPVKSIDNLILDSSANPVVDSVRREYEKLLEEYIRSQA
ncbi:MAG: aminotransferase class IV [Acetivibrionales bacterium]